MAGAKGFNCKKLGRCGCVPQSGFPALIPKAPGVIRGRAPSAERCKILFRVFLVDCASSLIDSIAPAARFPQKLADRWSAS